MQLLSTAPLGSCLWMLMMHVPAGSMALSKAQHITGLPKGHSSLLLMNAQNLKVFGSTGDTSHPEAPLSDHEEPVVGDPFISQSS